MTLAAKRQLLDGADPGDGLEAYRRLYREAPVPAADWLNCALYVDTKTYLADDILTKVDRMSMAVSLETRPPLLDHKVVEFVATLPPQFKLRGRQSKYLLRKTAARWVPEPILRRPKQGFRLPVAEWLRGPLREMARDVLLGPTAARRGLFQTATIERWWNEHQAGRRDHAHRLWLLLVFELWHRQYLDAPVVAPAH
jgi:asparagine synthase (glutamine-hydrolysing)